MKRILFVFGISAVATALGVGVYLVFQAARGPRHLSGPVETVSGEARHRGCLGIGFELAHQWASFIPKVLPDSPARMAGLREGNVIKPAQDGELHVDPNRRFRKEADLWAWLAKTQQAQTNDPPEGRADKQVFRNKDSQELERVRQEFLAECIENDRLYKRMVKANPHDTQAWQLLSWNAAHNLSVTTDDVNERYAYVKRGIEHLVEGVGHNPTNAGLYWHIGFYLHNRIGQSEARKPFRTLFRNDKEFHKLLAGLVDLKAVAGPDGLPDSFLVAQRWFEKTIAMVEKHGWPADLPKSVTPVVLHAYPAICQRAHAAAIENDGHFGEAAVAAWKRALKMWEALGEREYADADGAKYRLKDNEAARKLVNYDYWIKRCQVEQTELVLTARPAVYRAEEYLSGFKGMARWPWEENLAKQRAAFTDEARGQAKQLFDQAFRAWAEVYKRHPWLVEYEDELDNVIWQYQRRILNGKRLPDDFPLRDFPDLLPRTP